MYYNPFKFMLAILFAFFGISLNCLAQSSTGALIPFYIYPTDAAIQPLLDAARNYPNVPINVILNPASGAGQMPDPVYVNAITTLQKAGIKVTGYVYTNYNTISLNDLMAEILNWENWYKPDGIFLDAMGANLDYYQSLVQYIKSLGIETTIGNANQNVDLNYASVVDIVVVSNQNGLPNLNNYCNWDNANLPAKPIAFLAYNIPSLPISFLQDASKFSSWIYVTNGGGANPWGTLPSYFSSLISALDTSGSGTLVPFYIYPTSSALSPLISAKNAFPKVSIRIILNPNSGVGQSQDATYVQASSQLKQAGLSVLGYVHTSYSQRAIQDVENEILQWITWYNPDGIFLDEMGLNHTYYSQLTAFAKQNGISYVVGNPGSNIDVSAANDVDTLNIFENSSLPDLSNFSNWQAANVPRTKLGFISYNIPQLPSSAITQDNSLFGWMYITNNVGANGNPYDTLPGYFQNLVQALNTIDNN